MPAPTLLYLDTARLGQMSQLAQRLSIAFIRLSAEEPFSLYFEDFMREGFARWPDTYQRRFSGLRDWSGIESLRQGIRDVAGADPQASVILASRSLWLIRSCARTAFKVCRRILTTDLTWPTYQEVLSDEASRAGRATFALAVRRHVLDGTLGEDELVDAIVSAFHHNNCDGIFLPAVDNLGIRVPVERIVLAIESRSDLRFVLTDAAQALGHVPLDGICRISDCVIAGCHKWVRAYHPLGIGIIGRTRHASKLNWALNSHRIDDSLFGFLDCLEGDRISDHLETVNLSPLFSCEGAIRDLLRVDAGAFDRQCRNARLVSNIAADVGWKSPAIDDAMQSGIQLLRIPGGVEPRAVEEGLDDAKVRATVYENMLLRLSLPARTLRVEELERLRNVLMRWGRRVCKAPKNSEQSTLR